MTKPKKQERVWVGPPELEGLLVPLAQLREDPANKRLHGARSYDAIRASLRQFGQRKPIVVNLETMVVAAGNGTLEAARREGWTHLAVASTAGLTPEQVRGFALADNRVAELSTWDFGALAAEIGALTGFGPGDLGWTAPEIGALTGKVDMLDGMPALPNTDKEIGAMTFIVAENQRETVTLALREAIRAGEFAAGPNKNANGNALVRICQVYLEARKTS